MKSTYGQRSVVGYVITKFSRTDGSPNFLTHGAPLRSLPARESSTIMLEEKSECSLSNDPLCSRRNQAKINLACVAGVGRGREREKGFWSQKKRGGCARREREGNMF